MVNQYGVVVGQTNIMGDSIALEELFFTLSEKQLFTCPYFTKVKLLCLSWWDNWSLTLFNWPNSLKTRKSIKQDIERIKEKR